MAASAELQRMKDVECGMLNTKVFGNGIIIRQLESYISYNDLKRCRLLSKEMNQSVLANSNFISRSVVHISKELIAKNKHFDNVGFNMKNVKLHSWFESVKEGNDAYLDYVNRRGKEELCATFTDLNRIDCLDELKRSTFPSTWIHDMVLGAKELKELAISTKQLWDIHKLPLSDRMCKEAWSAKLESLKSLDLVVDELYTFEYLLQNFKKLEQLRLIDRNRYASDQALTMQLIHGNQESLVELQLNLETFLDFNALILLSLHFPKLRVIQFSGVKGYMDSFSSFLGNHKKQLTSVSMQVDGSISETLVAALNEIGTHLETLSVKSVRASANDELIEWEKFGKLQDLEFECNFSSSVSRISLTTLPDRLPAGLTRINILTHSDMKAFRLSRPLAFSFSSMCKLCHVTVLILRGVGFNFNCSMLHKLFQCMGQLIELELTTFGNEILKYGFPGTVDEPKLKQLQHLTLNPNRVIVDKNSAKSIQNLKALKKLTLVGFGLTKSIYLNYLKFPQLRQLLIGDLGQERIGLNLVQKILENNPILEKFEFYPPLDMDQSKELLTLVRRKYPALVACRMIGLKAAWKTK